MNEVMSPPVRARGCQAVVVELTGELDIATASSLSVVISEIQVRCARPGLLVGLDLSRLDFCDVSGLHVLAAADRKLAARDDRLALIAPQRHFLRLLRAAGLNGYFDVLPSLDVAVASSMGLFELLHIRHELRR